MSVRLKLLATFLVMITASTALGAYMMNQLAAGGALAVAMFDGSVTTVNKAHQTAAALREIDVTVETALRMDGTADWSRVGREFRDASSRILADLSTLDDDLATDEGRAAVRDALAIAQEWRSQTAVLLGLEGGATAIPTKVEWMRTEGELLAAIEVLVAAIINDARAQRATVVETVEATLLSSRIAIALTVLLGLALALILASNIVPPLRRAAFIANAVAEGNLAVEVKTSRRRDELGVLMRSLAQMRTALSERQEQERQRAAERQREAERRERDLRERAETAELASALGEKVGGISDTLASSASEMRELLSSMASSAKANGRRMVAVNASADEANASVQSVAESLTQITRLVGEIIEQAERSVDFASRASEDASRTNGEMSRLSDAAAAIGDVVELIGGITRQTHLLALNATIEAARAGEAGRGFSIVAREVKNLADETSKATEAIAEKINTIRLAVDGSASSIKGIGETIEALEAIAREVAKRVRDQDALAERIAGSMQAAAKSVKEGAVEIAEITNIANDNGRVAQEMLGEADDLFGQAQVLRSEIQGFVANVRRA